MREILFRGKRVDNGEWVYGDLVHDAFDGTSYDIAVGIRSPGCYPHAVIPETVGQFTGFEDKCGTKIFEGDTIKCTLSFEGATLPHAGVVMYDNDLACFGTSNLSGFTPMLNHCGNTRKIIEAITELTDET